MIQKLGGGRTHDHGPSAAVHSRHRVPGGVMVSQAIVPALSGRFSTTGTGGSLVPRLQDTPEQAAERRRQANRDAAAAYRKRR